MNPAHCIILIHALSTVMMAGLIWFVQVVHYPLMGYIGEGEFRRYEHEHMRRTTWVVAPLMMMELASAVAMAFITLDSRSNTLNAIGILLLVLIWVSTAVLQVPCHHRLSKGSDDHTVARLVATNWIRTIAWTLRAAIALAIVSCVGR